MPIFQKTADWFRQPYRIVLTVFAAALCGYFLFNHFTARGNDGNQAAVAATTDTLARKDSAVNPTSPVRLDTALYNSQLLRIANGDSTGKWPVKRDYYPRAGAILPFKRIVAYYGNFYSKKMGILGEYPTDEMLQRLQDDVKKWEKADSLTPVQPALHYIAVTAQGYPGKGNTYRLRMPFKQIDTLLKIAAKINAIVFLDVQVGCSNLESEIPQLEPYLKLPNVHLGIDPEFSMKTGKKPGTVIGTMDAADVNYAIKYLGKLVQANNLPPKILVVHRFTRPMLTNFRNVQPDSNVQVVVDMDGWGGQEKKRTSYKEFVAKEPIEYTGFKLFYKNDYREPKSRMLTPEEVLKLTPQPMYIQYQ